MENKEKYTAGFCYEIYIGIKDKDSYLEHITVEDFCKTLTEICAQKDIAFSLITQLGGYQHGRGYTTETSLRIVIIGANEPEITELGSRMKKIVNTDTIMITRSEIEYAFL